MPFKLEALQDRGNMPLLPHGANSEVATPLSSEAAGARGGTPLLLCGGDGADSKAAALPSSAAAGACEGTPPLLG